VARLLDPQAEQFVRETFCIVLGRAPTPTELGDQIRTFRPDQPTAFVDRLLSSPEFRLIYLGWKEGRGSGRDPEAREAGLRALGSDARFAARAYEILLGRPADKEGLRNFVGALADGATRSAMIRLLVLSEEFRRRYGDRAPAGGFLIRDTQLCELANPAKWDNPDWMTFLHELHVLSDHKLAMHRKSYEFTQLLYGLSRLDRLREDASVVSVGAGHECVLYWLANHVANVVATDLYEGRWRSEGAQEGDEDVLRRPEQYAPFPYRTDRLRFLKMDGRRLGFRTNTFDVAYSLSSIEHFGGVEGAIATIDEMARVTKPGGVLVLATEYALAGPPHDEVFQPAGIRRLIDRPGLQLVQPIDEAVYNRYEYVAVDLSRNPHETPHMVVRMGDTIFTTVMVFLEKASSA
jgi:SAM-dependent methyltransferase